MLQFVRCLELLRITQKLVSNVKDAFDVFYLHRVAEYPIKEPFFPIS